MIISLDYVKSKKNIICPLTKTLSKELVYNSSRKIGYLVDSRSQDLDLNKKLSYETFLVKSKNYYFLSIHIIRKVLVEK